MAIGAPSYGELVRREKSLLAIESCRPFPVALLAPSGYGKSALALQYAREPRFKTAWWIRVGETGLGTAACSRLASLVSDSPSADVPPYLSNVLARFESCEDGCLADTCVVLEDVPTRDDRIDPGCVEIAVALQRLGAHVLLNVRGGAGVRAVPGRGVRLLDAAMIRSTDEECRALSSQLGVSGLSDEDVAAANRACNGHVGLLPHLIRHTAAVATLPAEPGASLGAYLAELMQQLSPQRRQLFAVMSLLGKGTLTDLRDVLQTASREDALSIAETIPLVHAHPNLPMKFIVHELAQSYVIGQVSLVGLTRSFAGRLLETLRGMGAISRAAVVASIVLERAEMIPWLVEFGLEAVAEGAAGHVEHELDGLGVRELLEEPRLLLLQSRAFLETGRDDRALEKAKVLLALLKGGEPNPLRTQALLAVADCYCASGDNRARREALSEAIATGADGLGHHALVNAYLDLAAIAAYDSRSDEVLGHLTQAEVVACAHLDPPALERVRLLGGAVACVARGDLATAASCFSGAAQLAGNTISEKVRLLGNASVAYCETGRIARSTRLSNDALGLATAHGIDSLEETYALVGAALLMAELADSNAAENIQAYVARQCMTDRQSFEYNRVYCSTMLRALSRRDESLLEAEKALEFLARAGDTFVVQLAVLEVAASLLGVGDVSAARSTAAAQRAALDHANSYHLLRADMILAEIERREGRTDDAVARLGAHSEYILTESSNWQIAMYVRAFPELLGLFAKAIAIDKLPTHLLRMIPPETAEIALAGSRELLGDERWCGLGTRLFGEEEFERWRARDGRPLCRIRLFGGLDVSVGGRRIPDKEWRKRKSRLLFAMLAIRRGQDVAREQLGEYLWPDMDEVRARNNLYVTWNAMKSVLMGGKSGSCPYIENKGGLYRLVADNVRTDVDEFESWLTKAVAAEKAGDNAKALDAYRRAADLYRGDLLPGDLYDDWFAGTRDHYRSEYCNAMLRASDWLMSIGDPSTAGSFARRGINVDPYREDLYRSALRAQIATGQRGAAVDTYLQCRTKLVDDLGLDPSEETRLLYDEVLAMDGRPPAYPFDPLAE